MRKRGEEEGDFERDGGTGGEVEMEDMGGRSWEFEGLGVILWGRSGCR